MSPLAALFRGINFEQTFFPPILVRQKKRRKAQVTETGKRGWTIRTNPIGHLTQGTRQTRRKPRRMESPQQRGTIPEPLQCQAAVKLRKLHDGPQRLLSIDLPKGNSNYVSQMAEKRLHVPMVDRTPEEPPPVVVAVVGPPGVNTKASALLIFVGW